MKKKWIITGVIVVIVALISVNVWNQRSAKSAHEVETTTLQEKELEDTVIVPGQLKLDDEQTIYFQGDKGEVEEILVEEGDDVEEGDELIRYQNDELQNELKQNELQLKSDNLELDNIQTELEDIEEELDKDEDNEELQSEYDDLELQKQQKKLDIEQARMEKQSLEEKMADTTVTSDVDGTVVAIDEEASAGAEQAEQKPMMQIGSLDAMQVKGEISEYDTLKISEDQPVTLTSDAVPDKSWEGEIRSISDLPEESQAEDADSGATYTVEATVEDDDISLKPGFDMVMEVETDKTKADVLPLTAIEQDADTDYVYIVKDGTAQRQEVETGTATNDVIEIKDGLDKEADVIADPGDVSDGMDVDAQ